MKKILIISLSIVLLIVVINWSKNNKINKDMDSVIDNNEQVNEIENRSIK